VARDFLATVPPQHPFHGQLLKIFKRKLKRAKKRDLADDDDDDDEEEASDEEEDDDGGGDGDGGDGEEAEDEAADDICPAGCDTGLYELV
jgi:hypothetical protein